MYMSMLRAPGALSLAVALFCLGLGACANGSESGGPSEDGDADLEDAAMEDARAERPGDHRDGATPDAPGQAFDAGDGCPGSDCLPPPRSCPENGQRPDGGTCDAIGTDWWPAPEADRARSHHVPSGSTIDDLRAEHITPYGGWFTFTSVATPDYRLDMTICWSTEETGLDTAAGMDAARAAGSCMDVDVYDHEGYQVAFPLVVTRMQPNTTYFVRVAQVHYTGTTEGMDASNIVRVRTRPDPRVAMPATHPRVAATTALVMELRQRYEAGEERIRFWVSRTRARVLRAVDPNDSVYEPGRFGVIAALLWHTTGEGAFRDGALYLLRQELLPRYEDTTLSGNQYRWAGGDLAFATDLMWNELGVAERERILRAMLEEDELEANQDVRFADTDQFAANTEIMLAHGATFLGSEDLNAALLARLDAVFELALRRWYGVMQVKMRRAHGQHALAGGTMDDGTDYARGTQQHWLLPLWFLENVGMPQGDYIQWVWNNVRTHNLYPVLPDRSGMVSFGDIEGDSIEPNGSHALEDDQWSSDALKLCLLDRYARSNEAAVLRKALMDEREPSGTHPEPWALLCDHSGLGSASRTSLPTAYRANGFGLVFDRTGWGEEASLLFFTAGWRAVDHNQPDTGHFALWSDGGWVTNEIPSYRTEATDHNVLLLGGSGQLVHGRGTSRILETQRSDAYFFVRADITDAYIDHTRGEAYPYDSVTRSLYWDKSTDRIVVYDRVTGSTDLRREQAVLGDAVITQLHDEVAGDTAEMLSVVNGSGTLHMTDDELGIQGLVAFDRASGELR